MNQFNAKSVHDWIATSGGIGLIPKAPGTFGSLPGLLMAYLLHLIFPLGSPGFWPVALTLLAATFLVGVYSIAIVERRWNSHDSGAIVIDEVVGQFITVMMFGDRLGLLVVGFLFFRFFDILKPFPINWFDKNINNAWGTMLDDVVAGVFAAICLFGVSFFWNG